MTLLELAICGALVFAQKGLALDGADEADDAEIEFSYEYSANRLSLIRLVAANGPNGPNGLG